jgi:hypothetical protein
MSWGSMGRGSVAGARGILRIPLRAFSGGSEYNLGYFWPHN